MNLNRNFLSLGESYLFSDINRRVAEYRAQNPSADIIRLGIGDVTLPLNPAVAGAFSDAAAGMGDAASFRGYGEEQGCSFLRDAVAGYYRAKNVTLNSDEIFISDGAKSDLGNILDLFAPDNTVIIPDPVYPVYTDTNLMAGRKIVFAPATEENGYLPRPERTVAADIIYICSPDNPTGAVYDRAGLAEWVTYAIERDAVILFDAAYEAYIRDPSLPSSIYQIDGAERCAIEFCSLSKTAGFTGTRCGWTVVPEKLTRGGSSLRKMWLRRQTTKFNGVSYPVQRAAEAVFSPGGLRGVRESTDYYLGNAAVIRAALTSAGVRSVGDENSPYIWLTCPDGMKSWDFFELLLRRARVVGTPGAGFGSCGEGHLRLSAFGDRDRVKEACERIKHCL